MPLVKITRSNEYLNRLRNIHIFIDGHKIGEIANGQTSEFEISPGRHSVLAKIDWCSSREISFEANETNTFMLSGFNKANWIILIAVLIIIFHFILQSTIGFDYLYILLIPVFLIPFYFLTLGRKRYLTLIMQ
ncbi:MAG TPA: hypothetical protein PKH65_10345 [Bacteroidia bacterium]|nr:hypothetical protein [Bacteroidia bacterium]